MALHKTAASRNRREGRYVGHWRGKAVRARHIGPVKATAAAMRLLIRRIRAAMRADGTAGWRLSSR